MAGVKRKLIWVAAVLLVLAAAGYLVSAVTQRLEWAGFYGHDPGQAATRREAGRTTEFIFPHRPNGTFVFYTAIRNAGRWPVEVTEVSLYPESVGRLGPRYVIDELRYNYDGRYNGDAFLPDRALPWKAVTMAPHAILSMFVTVRMPEIQTAKGTVYSWENVFVRYKIMGLSLERQVPIGFFLSVQI